MRKLLYSDGSPFARKVRIVLHEKGLDYEADLMNGGLRPVEAIQEHNPALQVPTLYDRGGVLWGSNLILQYLYAAYPDAAVPNSPPLSPSLARPDRYWDDMLTITTIESLADAIVGYRLMIAGGPISENSFMDRQLKRVEHCLDWLEQRCTPEGFWPGTFSVMDINLMCPLIYGEARNAFDFRTGRWPRITGMVDRWKERPSVKATPINITAR
jgi:glutathione S-transferase